MELLLSKTAKYVSRLLNDNLTEDYHYHNLQHTKEVVKAAGEIGENACFSAEQLEVLLLAAWFHDTGIVFDYFNHEDKSIEICNEFLSKENYPKDKIETVASIINATKMPHNPVSFFHEVICDADIAHMGREDFAEKSELLRKEWESINSRKYSDHDWLQINIDFLVENPFYTGYAKKYWSRNKENNLKNFRERMRRLYNNENHTLK